MYASPSNNYWLVKDQPDDVRWSSASVAYVLDTDATYLAWLAAGYETSEIASEQELADLLNDMYPEGSPIPPVILPFPPLKGNGVIWQTIIKAVPTVMQLEADFTFSEKSPLELVPRSEQFREGLRDKEAEAREVPGGVAPFSALAGDITVPAGVYRLMITGQAGGGGGGGLGTTAGPGAAGAGGPGETRRVIIDVEPGEVIPYAIGAEGTGGVNNNPGTTAADLVIGEGPSFPVVAASATTNDTVASTTANVNLPAGIVAGNLLLLYLTVTNPGSTNPVITVPSGWTQLQAAAFGSSSRGAVFWKFASGSEGATVSIVTAALATRTSVALRITGNDLTTPPQWNGASEAGVPTKKPNPPNLTPSWGAKQTLWIAAAHVSNNVGIDGLPSNFENPIGTSGANGTRIATREINALSQNPTEFIAVWPSQVEWVTSTVAVLPSVAASTLTCKGGTFGAGNPGGAAGANGTTPTGSGGIRIDPQVAAFNSAAGGVPMSVGGATLFGQCTAKGCSTTSVQNGLTGGGYGSGGAGAVHGSAAAGSGGAGAPGMILIEGYGLDA